MKRTSMVDRRGLEELWTAGAGHPASEEVAALYRLAFQDFGAQMLRSRQPSAHPTYAQALRASCRILAVVVRDR